MKAKKATKKVTDEEYYDKRGVLGEIVEGAVVFSTDDALRQDILSGKRKKKIAEHYDQARPALPLVDQEGRHEEGDPLSDSGAATGRREYPERTEVSVGRKT